jgi:hypothetical protein
MWHGLALAILLPSLRVKKFEITARSERTFQIVKRHRRPYYKRGVDELRTFLGLDAVSFPNIKRLLRQSWTRVFR